MDRDCQRTDRFQQRTQRARPEPGCKQPVTYSFSALTSVRLPVVEISKYTGSQPRRLKSKLNMTGSRAVLWDMDGTLIDSAEYHWRAWRDTTAREGSPITHEQFLATFGQRNDSILRQWLGEKATPDLIQRIGDTKEALYRQHVREGGIEPLPGASDWVHRLQQQGWRQAIASAAPRANIETILQALRFTDCFEPTVSAEDVHRGKPDPEVFLVAATKLGVAREWCILQELAVAVRGIGSYRRGLLPLPLAEASNHVLRGSEHSLLRARLFFSPSQAISIHSA